MGLLGLEALRLELRQVEPSECASCLPTACFSKRHLVSAIFMHQIEDWTGRGQQGQTLPIIYLLPLSNYCLSNSCQKQINQKKYLQSCNPKLLLAFWCIFFQIFLYFQLFLVAILVLTGGTGTTTGDKAPPFKISCCICLNLPRPYLAWA